MVGHEALRRIDRWLGAPVCAALSGMRRIARWWGAVRPGASRWRGACRSSSLPNRGAGSSPRSGDAGADGAQRRSECGEPAFYNFAARFDGDIAAVRAAAQCRGLDLRIDREAYARYLAPLAALPVERRTGARAYLLHGA